MSAASSRVYVLNYPGTAQISTAISIVQLKAGATVPVQILRATCTQTGSTTSTQSAIQLQRYTSGGTVTAAVYTTGNLYRLGPTTDPTPSVTLGTSATGYVATAEGSGTIQVLKLEAWNWLNGWLYLPTPREYPFIDPATFCSLKFPSAQTANTFYTELFFEEMG